MGNEKIEDTFKELQELLDPQTSGDATSQTENTGTAIETGAAATGDAASAAPTATESSATPDSVPSVSAEDHTEIIKDILKIDLQIETLSKQTVDVSTFYDNLESELSEEEQQLEFTDKPAYMKLVSQKAKEYEEKHSSAPAIAELEKEKQDLVSVYERQSAILQVTAKYPQFSYEKVFDFFSNKLNKEQQDAVYDGAKSYADVYEKAYLSFIQTNPINIQQQAAPILPDLNTVHKRDVDTGAIETGLLSDEQILQDALGI